jgi:hypothetical protein
MLKYQSNDASDLNQLKQAYATWIPLPTWPYLTCSSLNPTFIPYSCFNSFHLLKYIFRQTPYNSRVMVILPSLDLYRKLSIAKQINSRSLNIHTLPSIDYSRARTRKHDKCVLHISHEQGRVKPMHKQYFIIAN